LRAGRYTRRRPSAIPANGYAGNTDGLRTDKPGREDRFLGNALWRQVLLALPSAMVIWGAEEPYFVVVGVLEPTADVCASANP
jgi:hypothetical protein